MACGQKGSLYLPQNEEQNEQAQSHPEAVKETENKVDQ